jgi:predicted nucleic acid-binding protein
VGSENSRGPQVPAACGAKTQEEMIFDSDILIRQSRGNQRAANVVNAAADREMSIISLMELLQGARSKVEVLDIKGSLRMLGFRVLPLSESIGATAAALVEEHNLATGIQLADALIAATALASGEPLCTGNTKHFRSIKKLSCVAFRP